MQQNLKYIKRLRHIFAVLAWTLVGVYAVVVVLLHIPAVQHFVASEVSGVLSDKLGTKVQVGNVNLGLLNRAIIDDVLIKDQQHHDMLLCHRLSAKIEILPLLSGRISISSAQVFGMKAMITKADADAPLNCQFMLDSLASKDTTSHTPLDLHISSLVIRNTALTYDRMDMPHSSAGLDVNHIAIDKLSSHIMLYTLTDDSLSVRMKRLSFAEKSTGFAVNDISFFVNAGKHSAELKNFNVITDYSDIAIDAKAEFKDKQIKRFSLTSDHSSVSSRDLACFIPQVRDINTTFFIDTDLRGDNKHLNINNISIRSSNKALELQVKGKAASQGSISDALKTRRDLSWNADIDRLLVSGSFVSNIMSLFGTDGTIFSRLGSIDYTAKASGRDENITLDGVLNTAAGQLSHIVSLKQQHLNAQVSSGIMKLGYLLDTDVIGDTEITADINADIADQGRQNGIPLHNASVNISAPLLTAKGYPYHNVKINVLQQGGAITSSVDIADLNINAAITAAADNAVALFEGKPELLRNINVSANISNCNPQTLGLTDKWQSTTFSVNAEGNIASLTNPFEHIIADINDFTMSSPDDHYHCSNIHLLASQSVSGRKDITMTSDFADLHAEGMFDPASLPQSLTNLVAQKLPTLPGIARYKAQDNDLSLTASVKRTDIFRKLLGVDINATDDIDINAMINDRLHLADITISAPAIQCFGMTLNGTHIHATSPGDTLSISAVTAKRNYDGSDFALAMKGKASNNNLVTSINWHNGNGNDFRGSFNAVSQFFLNTDSKPTATVKILPSEVLISDTLWNLHPAMVSYYANHLSIDNFLVENGRQHVSINGVATKSANDSIVVNLHDINVAYIMNLVDFHSVEFSGFASGNVVGKALFSEPQAHTTLKVRNFLFENGRLGTLTANGSWDNDLGQIDINAWCEDKNVIPAKGEVQDFCSKSDMALEGSRDGFVKIDGYISIKRNFIDLDIKATNARLEFLNTYTSSFLSDINAWANGRVRIIGPLSAINMTGEATANGSVLITPLNTVYTLHDDYVRMVPDNIIFVQDTIFDKHGNKGFVNGELHHRNLGKMTFDLNIDAKHLLCFDFPNLDGSTFCGHVIGTGNCKITGRPGEVNFDIDAYPEETSYITYNASSPDALQNQEFITWRESTPASETTESVAVQADGNDDDDDPDVDFRTNIHLNFLVHATPASTLRLIMDQRTGDIITLNGNGTLRAHYYNKGGMQIFGNYYVERGEYKMTLQQVITKNFEFLPGGTIAFGGEPFDAAIDLQAQYVVPSAPLSDLNIGNSFTSSTVRVNCLMNISGTAEHPVVDFDLNLPQASTDIQQMITALMDSEEARNQQVVYLLAIGRFYSASTAADATQSQASLAMQSFLSGTVSQQLNNLISNVIIKDNNWNFGANISPGDEGMMNAEYEGLVSGRMLNNRLLINGQFGYRDNVNATTSFIGDFDVRYLLFPNGNLQVKVYNQTSDRYFTKSNLNTQGLGVILKHDFNSFIPYFLRKKKTNR